MQNLHPADPTLPHHRPRVTRRGFLKAAIGSGALLFLAGCAPAAPPPAPTTPPAPPPAGAKPAATSAPAPAKPSMSKVRILYNVSQDPTFMLEWIAYKYLKDKYGIESDVQEITGADASIKALIAGQAEFALSTMASGILAVGQGQAIKAAIPAASTPYFTLVVPNEVKDWKDLAGKRVGITATSDSSYYTTLLQFKKYGVDPKSVEWITVRGAAARVDAMRAGKIDAGQLSVGAALDIAKDGKFKRFASVGKDFPNLLFSAYWVTDKTIKEHPGVIQAFAESEMQAHRDGMDRAKFMAEAVPRLKGLMEESTISESYDILRDMNIWDPNEARWNTEAGDFTTKTMAESEAIEKFVPFSQWATTQFTDAARQKLGAFKG